MSGVNPQHLNPFTQKTQTGIQPGSATSTMCLGKNFILQNVLSTHDLVVAGPIFWAHHPDLEGPGPIEIELEQAPFIFFLIWTCKKPADYGPQQH